MKKFIILACLGFVLIAFGCANFGETWKCPSPHDILTYNDGTWECVEDGVDGPAPSPEPAPAPAPEPSPEPDPEPECESPR